MSATPAELAPTDFVLRRVHKNMVDAGPPPGVTIVAFRPTPEDTAGLSLYRESLVSAAEVAASGRKPGDYYVVRLPVQAFHDLGLKVVADEQPDGPKGHALVPEMTFDAYQKEKARWRPIQVVLAKLASRNIVLFPTPGG